MTTVTKKSGLFTPIVTGEDALKMVRDASLAFFFVAALQGLLGAFLFPALITDAVIIAVLAGILMKWRSRVAAVLLLVVTAGGLTMTVLNRLGVTAQGGKNIILAIIMVVAAVRAVEATFKLHGRYHTGVPA
jgi:cellulose synthase/poly-beta-1,6-N-acetylglucosamine synthase-like glycosyltransferase